MKPIKVKVSKKLIAYNLPKSILDVVKDDLTVLNPKWLENKKMGRWNGNTTKYHKMYTRNKNVVSMPAAYMEDLFETLTHFGKRFDVIDQRVHCPVKFKFKGELRDYQKEACAEMLRYDFGTLESATGSGKTVMALYTVAANAQRTLIVVHTNDLADQWFERLQEFLDVSSHEIGFIGGGKLRVGRRITIAMVQSLYKCAEQLSKDFGYVIVDECHRTPSRTFTEAISNLKPKKMMGLSATPFRRDNLQQFIFWFVGPMRHKVEKEQLYENGHIVKPLFIMRSTPFTSIFDPVNEYSTMLSDLTLNEERNKLICKDVAAFESKNTACLILSDRKDHCDRLKAILKYSYNKNAALLTGDVKTTQRRTIINKINQGKIQHVIATGQLIGEGFDCKNLSALYLASPIKFSGRVLQYIGRIMRPDKSNTRPTVYDYVDWNISTLANSARSRMRVYGKENIIHK